MKTAGFVKEPNLYAKVGSRRNTAGENFYKNLSVQAGNPGRVENIY
jgi:hypothetical protein